MECASPLRLTLSAYILIEATVIAICNTSACMAAHAMSACPWDGQMLPLALQAEGGQRCKGMSCDLQALEAHWHRQKAVSILLSR